MTLPSHHFGCFLCLPLCPHTLCVAGRQLGKDHLPAVRMFKLFDMDVNGLLDYQELLVGFQKLKCDGEDGMRCELFIQLLNVETTKFGHLSLARSIISEEGHIKTVIPLKWASDFHLPFV